MPPLSVMVKPASSLCNMRCAYCFYHSLSETRETYSYGFMGDATVEAVAKNGAAFTNGAPFSIAFQGGEPTLAGLDFFEKFTATVKQYRKDAPVSYALQTNGLLIDDDWAKFFLKHNFLIGLSLDGDPENNACRIDANHRYTTERALHAAHILEKHGVPFNILSVVTKQTAKRINSVLDFYEAHGFSYLQFIPCLKPFGVSEDPYGLNEEEFARFLSAAWKRYERRFFSPNPLSIRFFDNLLLMATGKRAEQCGLYGHCGIQFIVEGNGDVFPCDFYCLDEWKLGNVNECDFKTLALTERAKKFISESLPIREECKVCNYYRLCLGGCKRYLADLDYCRVMKTFFSAVLPSLHRISHTSFSFE